MPAEEALGEMRRAVQDDPLNSWVGAMHAFLLGIVGMHAESIAEAERALSLDAESFFAHWNLVRANAWAGNHERAIQEAPALLSASARHPWALGLLGWTYAQAGRADQARACYDELEGRSRHEFVAPSWLAVLAGSVGLMDDAMRWAERAAVEHDPVVLWGRSLPFWSSLRADPRFAGVMRGLWS
jgi:tetratricopeptide (TPR) repeat protein